VVFLYLPWISLIGNHYWETVKRIAQKCCLKFGLVPYDTHTMLLLFKVKSLLHVVTDNFANNSHKGEMASSM